MAPTVDLERVEQQVWTAYFADGLWEIFLATLMLTSFLRPYTDSLWAYLLMAGGILAMILGKKHITEPRLGRVKFGPSREARRSRLMAIILILVIVTAVLLALAQLGVGVRMGNWAGIVLAGMVTAVFLFTAYLLNFRRMYGYAWVIGGAIFITEVWGEAAGMWANLIGGLLLLATGLFLLAQFLRRHNVPEMN
ncbi:MAG: hypothetical protein IPF56_20365 [Chloroflexi bacterium]|nr:hypothetical protein [Chloroflexota bacterium]MBK6710093.1 hypothetical protein [Chloroflexota bacterium]MBK7919888.1 hypothetical protein [Chloroflexota bacterium]